MEENPAIGAIHPEEIIAGGTLRIGTSSSMSGAVRITPAGLVTLGIMMSGILLSVATVIWATRRNPG